MNKDRVVFFPDPGEMGIQVQGITCKENGGRAVGSQGALAGCFAAYCAVSAGKHSRCPGSQGSLSYSVRIQLPSRLPQA